MLISKKICYAGWQGADSMVRISTAINFGHLIYCDRHAEFISASIMLSTASLHVVILSATKDLCVTSTSLMLALPFIFKTIYWPTLRLASALRRRRALTFFSCVYVFIGLQACFAGWLDPKVTKDQGLHLMSDKFVKALMSAVSRLSPWLCPPLALDPVLDCAELNGYAKALTFSPSFRSYAGWQGAEDLLRNFYCDRRAVPNVRDQHLSCCYAGWQGA
uniref:hypothetical protein n=1 Tax=Pedobacter sp. UBA5917 TaxID=1947061 RepID=UPI0025FF1139